MAKYRFSREERYAIFTIHGPYCYINSEPINLKTMCVDHILPASLLNDPEKLAECLHDYGLPETFEIHSFENWLPCCPPCNRQKGAETFAATVIVQAQLSRARKRAADVRAVIDETVSKREIAKALAVLELAQDADKLDHATIEALIPIFERWRDKGNDSENDDPVEFRLAPTFTVLYEPTFLKIVETNRGVGYIPHSNALDTSFYCGNCGSLGPWNGARCMGCGELIQDD